MSERNIGELPLIGAPAGDQTHNSGLCPDHVPRTESAPFRLTEQSMPNQLSCTHVSQGRTLLFQRKTLSQYCH